MKFLMKTQMVMDKSILKRSGQLKLRERPLCLLFHDECIVIPKYALCLPIGGLSVLDSSTRLAVLPAGGDDLDCGTCFN